VDILNTPLNVPPDAVNIRQTQIILALEGVLLKIEESKNELKLLRTELGMDSTHGRIPLLEASIARHEARMEKMDALIDKLIVGNSEAMGKKELLHSILALAGGGAGGAIIAILGRLFLK
jgi:hypothetical protein